MVHQKSEWVTSDMWKNANEASNNCKSEKHCNGHCVCAWV